MGRPMRAASIGFVLLDVEETFPMKTDQLFAELIEFAGGIRQINLSVICSLLAARALMPG